MPRRLIDKANSDGGGYYSNLLLFQKAARVRRHPHLNKNNKRLFLMHPLNNVFLVGTTGSNEKRRLSDEVLLVRGLQEQRQYAP